MRCNAVLRSIFMEYGLSRIETLYAIKSETFTIRCSVLEFLKTMDAYGFVWRGECICPSRTVPEPTVSLQLARRSAPARQCDGYALVNFLKMFAHLVLLASPEFITYVFYKKEDIEKWI